MVGDFVTDSGQSVVLSGETLASASDMSVSLPDPSEKDSLLLNDTGDNGGDGDEGSGESMSRNEHETGDSGPDNGENAFDYDWCEAEPKCHLYRTSRISGTKWSISRSQKCQHTT